LLSALELLPEEVSSDVRDEVLAMGIKARRELGTLDIQEIQHDLDTLLGVATSAQRPAIRARAVCIAATLSNFTRNTNQAGATYDAAKVVPEAELQAHDRAAFDCARAMLAFQLGDSRASLKHLEVAEALTISNGLASSVAVRVHMGLGIHACLQGRYEEGITHHTRALQAAMRLGNDGLCASACGNLAACFGRLGMPRDQLRWAQRALAYRGTRFEGYTELQAAYWAALAYASLDDRLAALDTMARVDAHLPEGASEAIHSVWALMKADVLWALGSERAAKAIALNGIACEPVPHFEGSYARWLAATAITPDELMHARLRIESLRSTLVYFDAVDQAEILIARQMVASALGQAIDGQRELADAFERLPPSVGAHLARFATMATSNLAPVLTMMSAIFFAN
jgi:tetratricopeptide (TPR) repeat protein